VLYTISCTKIVVFPRTEPKLWFFMA